MSLSVRDKTLKAIRALVPESVFRINAKNEIIKFEPANKEPTPAAIATKIVEQDAERAAEEAIEQQAAVNKAIIQGRADIRALIRMSPAEIDNWIDNNVTSLGEARTLFKRLTNVVAILAEREFR